MSKNIRVAFTLFDDDSWTGGVNYLRNLFRAINELPESGIVPVLFVSPDNNAKVISSLACVLSEPPIVVNGWKKNKKNTMRNLLFKMFLQRDKDSLEAFRLANIDIIFQNDKWYGFRFPIPTLAWIADFQHKHLTSMFTKYRGLKRDLAYTMLCRSASEVMVSSQDAASDCKHFFNINENKISVVPFAVQFDESALNLEPKEIALKYDLPEKYFYFPGQLWKHKNHLALLQALCILKSSQPDVVIVITGNLIDTRNPEHPKNISNFVKENELENNVIFLKMVPYEHVVSLMRASVAMANPSLFEGWSTTVEEAKALGVPMLLSDLNVHKEQAVKNSLFFNPLNTDEIASVLSEAWNKWEAGPRLELEKTARESYKNNILSFALNFEKTIKKINS